MGLAVKEKFMHIPLLSQMLCYVLACFFILLNPAYANTDIQTPTHATCQAQIQQISSAKAISRQSNTPPTQGWYNLENLPDQWLTRWPDFHGTAWYKIVFQYRCPDNASKGPLTLSIESITQTGQVFINQDLLWKDVSTEEPISRNVVTPHIWNIPNSSLHQGENILLVQVHGSQTQKSGIGKVLIGDYNTVYDTYSGWILEKKTLTYLNAMLNFVIAIICFLVWMVTRDNNAFFWFGAVSILWVIYSLLVVYSDPIPYLSSINIDRLQNIIFSIYVAVGCLAAWRFAHAYFPKIEKALFIFCVISTISIVFTPDTYIKETMQVFFGIGVIIFLIKCLTYPYIAYKSKIPETYFMSVTYLAFVPIAINDAVFMSTMQGQPLSPYTAPFSSMSIGIILAFRLARDSREIARFNKTLNETVIQTKNKLTNSLGLQQKLAVQNARLQERINLSHDLHDGLGGSIFRSMVLLEQNEKIEKNQVLSILKLLRSDLRQVIDSGASLGSEIPATPIEWAASIRHRFVQLFEEMDIHSTWDLPKQWHTSPTTLQCLTLTRLVEEALTNIMKHSQATQVTIHSYENEMQQLILNIIDNGCGFTPVTDHFGLHVGLHSMRTRIQRIGGTFNIESQPGHTQIQAVLPLQNHLFTPEADK